MKPIDAPESQDVYAFPAAIEVKAIGADDDSAPSAGVAPALEDFETCVRNVIVTVLPAARILSTRRRPSRNKRYVSITHAITFTSRAELDAVHAALIKEPRVLWVL